MNYQFDDRDIKMLYEENTQRTAPDMDKLWSRIESEIDKTDDVQTTRKIHSSNRKRQTRALASLAAALVLAAGIGIYAAVSSSVSKDKSGTNDTRLAGADENHYTKGGSAVTDGGIETGGSNSLTAESIIGKTYGIGDAAEEMTSSGDTAADETPAVEAEQQTAEQKSAAVAAYTAEEKALVRADCILDARVTGMDQIGDHCTYTLEVVKRYDPDSETEGGTVKLEADIPIGLTVGAEYLIPAFEDEKGLHPVIVSEPQIMFSGDGRIVFSALWDTLAKGAENTGDGFLSAEESRMQELVAKWRSLK